MRKIVHFKQIHKVGLLLIIGLLLGITGCGSYVPESTDSEELQDTGLVVAHAGTYDCADTKAVIVAVNKSDNTITFYNRKMKRNYTLSYDGTTKLYDKYGSSLVIEQISTGEIVDVTFLKSQKKLNSLSKSKDTWTYSDISDYEINELGKSVKLVDGEYRYSDDLLIFANGEKAQMIDINSCDLLSFCGEEHNIYSIVVSQGHGYLRLKGQDYFEGGWIEIGPKIIKTVTKDMLLAVPVGTYNVTLTNGEYSGVAAVTIESNKETELDVTGMVQPQEKQYGKLILVTNPKNVEVYADGEKVDTDKPISLEYGIHQLLLRAEGYDTLTQYIKVGQENATLEIALEKSSSDTKEEGNPQASPVPQVTTYVTQAVAPKEVGDYRVKIESPQDAEVYVDGDYVGKVPVEFAKVSGSHVITLRKDKCETRSYTISLDTLLQNETFSFAELKQTEESPEE